MPSTLASLGLVYGISFTAMSSVLALLYGHALRKRIALELNAFEELGTRHQRRQWWVMALTGVVSSLWAGLLPTLWGVWAGMIYMTLAASMPILAIGHEKQARALEIASR